MKINQLPAPTWRWMRVNETETDDISRGLPFSFEADIPEGVETGSVSDAVQKSDPALEKKSKDELPADILALPGGLGKEFADTTDIGIDAGATIYGVGVGIKPEAPLYQDFIIKGNSIPSYVNRTCIHAERNSQLIIVQFISYEGEVCDNADYIMSTRFELEQDSDVKLIQIQNLPEGVGFYNDCAAECGDRARFEHIQLVLGGGRTYMGDHIYLNGYKSAYSSDIAYNLTGNHSLDMNYIADHNGAKTLSDINVSGVMADKSSKIFRGTIDFHKGCKAAKGSELEDVLLMNEGVVNKTVPLILCDEEDVEGSHGASIGRLDESLMLYMLSRGLDEESIYRSMARARIDKVAGLIDDERSRRRIEDILSAG